MPSATAIAPSRHTETELTHSKQPVTPSWVGRIPQLKPGHYSDGMPLHDVHYLSCKLILHPNKFTSRKSLFDFAKVMKDPCREHGVEYSLAGFDSKPEKIREVLFIDTKDFRLYNNAFIARRRIPYKHGFPVGEPEIVFKFRHPDMQVAAETDVRPFILGDHIVKFKCQALPLKDQLGGIRVLFSHNVQFFRSAIGMGRENVRDMDRLIDWFPVLERIRKDPGEPIKLVSDTIIEEVRQDIGMLDFGHGICCKANVAIWRTRGEHRPLIGEFAYQFKFQDRATLASEALKRAEAFFISLQYAAEDYIALNCTKTGTVYRLLGNSPKSHE